MYAPNHGQVKAIMHAGTDGCTQPGREDAMNKAEKRARLHMLVQRIACIIRLICKKNGLQDCSLYPFKNECVSHEFQGLDFGPYAGEAGKEFP